MSSEWVVRLREDVFEAEDLLEEVELEIRLLELRERLRHAKKDLILAQYAASISSSGPIPTQRLGHTECDDA